MDKEKVNDEIPKLVVLELKQEFTKSVNQSNKIKLTDKVIVVGEDEEYTYFIDLLTDTFLYKEGKETVIKLDNEINLINKYVDLEWIYRTKPETLFKNLVRYENTNQFVYQTLNYDNQISILRNLIKNMDVQSKNLPKVINIIKRIQEQHVYTA